MLHLAHDAAPGREVGAQDVQLVEATEFMHQAPRALEEAQEEGAVGRIGAEFRRDAFPGSPQGAQGAGRHALEVGEFLHEQEGVEDGGGLLLEKRFAAYVRRSPTAWKWSSRISGGMSRWG